MNITLRDVAREANVSNATVSRALNRPELVDVVTRERVVRSAKALGYRPNRVAQALSTSRKRSIAVVVAEFDTHFFLDIVTTVQRGAFARGMATVLAFCDDPAGEIDVVDNLISQVDGIVLCGSQLSDELIERTQRAVPVVLIDRDLPGVSAVSVDYDQGIAAALHHLNSLGHNKVCCLGGVREGSARLAARAASVNLGIELVEIGWTEPTFAQGIEAVAPILNSRASAVLALSDVVAAGVSNGLSARGIRVPQEISVVGVGDTPLAQMLTPALTTVNVPRRHAGNSAIELLNNLMTRPVFQADTLRLPASLVVRESTAPSIA